MPKWWGHIFLADSQSPLMEELNYFHDHALLILTLIIILVSYMMVIMFFNKFMPHYFLTWQLVVVIILNITPLFIFIFLFIAFTSSQLLYLTNEIHKPSMSIETIGHQWYWSPEYSDFKTIEFDSYMTSTEELNPNEFRLLEVDNQVTTSPMMYFYLTLMAFSDLPTPNMWDGHLPLPPNVWNGHLPLPPLFPLLEEPDLLPVMLNALPEVGPQPLADLALHALPEVGPQPLADLALHALPEVGPQPLADLALHALPEVGPQPLADLVLHALPEVGPQPLPDLVLHALPEVGPQPLPDLVLHALPEVGPQPLPDMVLHALPEEGPQPL